jgi:hypothetical protein
MMAQASHDQQPHGAYTTSAEVIAAAMTLFLFPFKGRVFKLRGAPQPHLSVCDLPLSVAMALARSAPQGCDADSGAPPGW